MGRNRRQQRLRQRRNEAASNAGASTPLRRPPPRPAWRQMLDQWGGLPVVGSVLAVILVVGVLVWQNLPQGVDISDEPQLGEAVEMTGPPYSHISDESRMDIEPGVPPVGGPHFPAPLNPGIYDEPQQDGLIVHSLEHGMIWLSYNPELISDDDLETMLDVARDNSNDVVVSPRPDNDEALYAVSWGRRMLADTPVDAELLNEFIRVNVNRSPEPGLR